MRPGARNAGPGLDLGKEAFEGGRIFGADFQHMGALARNGMAFEDLIDRAGVVHEAVIMFRRIDGHHDKGGNILPEFLGIHDGGVCHNDAAFLEFAEPLADAWKGEADLLGDLNLGNIGVLLEKRNDLSILLVQVDRAHSSRYI